MQVAIYAGVPAGVDSFRIAREVFAEARQGLSSDKTQRSLMEIGFIGLGKMGFPMARRLIEAGHQLIVFDTRKEAVDRLVALGAQAASSPKDVADRCETVLASLPSLQASLDVATGTGGVIEGKRVKRFVDLSTVGSQMAVQIHDLLAKKNIVQIDSPVSGGVGGAEKGTLAVMVSGPRADFELLKPALDVIGKVFFIGEKPGSAQTMKLANNFLSATAMVATSEAVVMGVKSGLDPAVMIDVINAGSGMNTASRDKFPRSVLPRTFDFGFATGLMVKDVRLCLDEMKSLGLSMEVAEAVGRLWEVVIRDMGPESDFTSAIKPIEKAAGVVVGQKCRLSRQRSRAAHRYHASIALSSAPSMTGRTTTWFMPDFRASDAAINSSCFRFSLTAGMPVAQAPPIEPSPLWIVLREIQRVEIGILAAIAGVKHQHLPQFVRHPDLEAQRDRRRLRRQKRHHPGLVGQGLVGDADAAIDADLGGLLPAQKALGVVQILDDERHSRLPGPPGQAEAARKLGVARIEFEHVGGAVIAVDQPHFVGDIRVVVPQLDRPDVLVVVTTQQHHDRGQELAGEHRQRNPAGQSGFLCLVDPLEIGILELGEHDRMAGGPGLARQALAIGEQRVFAERAELRKFSAAQSAAVFEAGAGSVRHPQFDDFDEGLHWHQLR